MAKPTLLLNDSVHATEVTIVTTSCLNIHNFPYNELGLCRWLGPRFFLGSCSCFPTCCRCFTQQHGLKIGKGLQLRFVYLFTHLHRHYNVEVKGVVKKRGICRFKTKRLMTRQFSILIQVLGLGLHPEPGQVVTLASHPMAVVVVNAMQVLCENLTSSRMPAS